jgi:hypothetical protein
MKKSPFRCQEKYVLISYIYPKVARSKTLPNICCSEILTQWCNLSTLNLSIMQSLQDSGYLPRNIFNTQPIYHVISPALSRSILHTFQQSANLSWNLSNIQPCTGSSGAVHSVFLINVYLDLESPGGSGIWVGENRRVTEGNREGQFASIREQRWTDPDTEGGFQVSRQGE